MPLKLPPYGRQLKISDLQFLFVFVGEPECWQHCQQKIELGLHNSLCLPDPEKASEFRWPVKDCQVIVIIFNDLSFETESQMVAVFCQYQPVDIIIRHWPSTELIIRRRCLHERR